MVEILSLYLRKKVILLYVALIFLLLKVAVKPDTCILQGELMAWWCATLKDGGKTPSEEDLRLKVEEMKMLGF